MVMDKGTEAVERLSRQYDRILKKGTRTINLCPWRTATRKGCQAHSDTLKRSYLGLN